MTRFTRYTCASAALIVAGCVPDGTLVKVEDPEGPGRLAADIEVASDDPEDPHTVDFGQVPAGGVAERDVTITNRGLDNLQVQGLDLGHPAFSFATPVDPGLILTPERSARVTLAYEPRGDETLVSELRVASNDPDDREVSVTLLAEGLAPAVRVSPESFDFGNPVIGCNATLEVEIANVGRAPLVLDRIEFADLSGRGELVAEVPAAGDVLAPGAPPIIARIHYTPTDAQPDNGVLTVFSNDPARPAARSEQFGIAHSGESVTDAFAQDGSNETDILFVVDNSGSMSQEQTNLAVNFSSFVQIVEALDVEYRLGVTSTDASTCANLAGSTPIVTPSTPDPTGTFATNVDLGTGGSPTEQGLLCGQTALSNPANDQFLRDAAGLRVMFVSDENDFSPAGVSDYVQYYQSLKERPEDAILSDISGGLAGCTGAGGQAFTAARYVAASVATGGISASICDSNWVATLSSLAWLSQSVPDTFELSRSPVEDSIEVRINGAGIYVGWTYNSALQAIVFDGSHVPENGDEIEIEYAILGECGD